MDEDLKQQERDFQEITKKLEDAAMMERLLKSPEWKVWNDAWQYLADQAKNALKVVDPDNKTQIMRLQLQIQFFEDVIPNTIKQIKLEGEEAWEAADSKGWMRSVLEYLNK
jgi:wobble nucleotide-excising tRNase